MNNISGKFILAFVICFQLIGFSAHGDGGEEAQVQKQSINIAEVLYVDTSDLDTSLAVRKENGRIYLLVEVDHNFVRNEFVVRLSDVGLASSEMVQVVKGNLNFGFNNKNIAILPLLERVAMEGSDNQKRIFALDSAEHRTQQQIDITDVLRQAAHNSLLTDANGNAYRVAEIHELLFVMAINEEGRPKKMLNLKVDLGRLQEGETLSLHGQKEVTRIPLASFEASTAQPKLSVDTVTRYFQPILLEIQDGLLSLNRKEKIVETLKAIPFEIEKSRIGDLADAINSAESAEDILRIIMGEQVRGQLLEASRSCHLVF